MHSRFISRGWWSRFDFPKTIEVTPLLHRSGTSKHAIRRYGSLQHWEELYPVSGVAPIRVRQGQFSILTGLRFSFCLRSGGIFSSVTHHVFAFDFLSSRFYVIYGSEGILLHCFADESPGLVARVIGKLYVRVVLPLVCRKIHCRKDSGRRQRRSTG